MFKPNREMRVLAILISFLLIFPNVNVFASEILESTLTSNNASNSTVFYSEKAGVKEFFAMDASGNKVSISTNDIGKDVNTKVSENEIETNTQMKTLPKTGNIRRGPLAKLQKDAQSKTQTAPKANKSDDKIASYDNKDKTKKNKAYITGELLIKFKDNVSVKDQSSLLNKHSLKKRNEIKSKNIVLASIINGSNSSSLKNALLNSTDVEFVQPNYIYYPESVSNDPLFPNLWGLENTGQNILGSVGQNDTDIDLLKAWETTQGSHDIVIGVIDTGIDFNHPDLQNAAWINSGEITENGIDDDGNGYIDDINGWDFYNYDNTVFDDQDIDDHGTHVAGTIAATSNSVGVVGIAPNVKIMSLKFIGPNGGDSFAAISAIEYAKAKGVKVLNNSWGMDYKPGYYDQLLKDAIEDSGTLFVVAAGNEGNNNDLYPSYPSSYECDNIISVAALNNTGDYAGYSNYGIETVDVAAPGSLIESTVPKYADWCSAILTNNTLFHGFGLETLESDADRRSFMESVMDALDVETSANILLVRDDAPGYEGNMDCYSYYANPLTHLGYTFSISEVPYGGIGPSAELMGQYDLVIWYTGEDVFCLNESDQSNLKSYLDGGGKLYLSGRDAGWDIEHTDFYIDYLHAMFIDETQLDERRQVDGQNDTSFEGESYTFIPSIYIDYLKPVGNATVVLKYTPEADYSNAYKFYNGTSMAAPHVTGIAALLLSQNSEQSVSVLKRKIMKSAEPVYMYGMTVTNGLVNAANALSIPDSALDDDIPGVPFSDDIVDTLDQSTDLDDVYSIELSSGETVTFYLNGIDGTSDFDLHLYSPYAKTVFNAQEIWASSENVGTSSEKIEFTAPNPGTYFVDVYAYAGSGSYSLTKSNLMIIDDTDPSLEYIGNWNNDSNVYNSGGTAHVLNSFGSVAAYNFVGSEVKWVGFKDSKQGVARVFVDNELQGTVNLYSPIRQNQQVLFEKSLTYGSHNIMIEWTGTWDKHTGVRKTDTAINIDSLTINTAKTPPKAPDLVRAMSYPRFIGLDFYCNNVGDYIYNIYRSTDNVHFSFLNSFSRTSTSTVDMYHYFDENGLESGVIYYYYVTATNSLGESEPSNIMSGSRLPINSIYTLDDTSDHILYHGNWSTLTNSDLYVGGSIHTSVNAGDYIEIPYIGYEISATLATGPEMGVVRVYWGPIDNGNYKDINLYSPTIGTWNVGTMSSIRNNYLWTIECISGMANIDYAVAYDYTTTPPVVPYSLTGELVDDTIYLSWVGNTEVDHAGYNLYRSVDGAPFVTVAQLLDLQTSFSDMEIEKGKTYEYYVKAYNFAEFESEASNTIQVSVPGSGETTTIIENTDTSVIYSGTWTKSSNSNASGTYYISRTTGNTIDFTFTGNSIKWYGIAGANRGIASVSIDNDIPVNVDCYNASTVFKKQLYGCTNLSSGSHTIKITVSGTKNSLSSGPYIDLDYFEIGTSEAPILTPTPSPSPSPIPTVMVKTENSEIGSITYSGAWTVSSNANASEGSYHISKTTGDTISYTFTGIGIRWYGTLAVNRGIATVSIDNGTPVNVDCYASTSSFKKLQFEMINLPYGIHTIKIQVTGTRNNLATGSYIDLDFFETITYSSSSGSIPSNIQATPTPINEPIATPELSAIPTPTAVPTPIVEPTPIVVPTTTPSITTVVENSDTSNTNLIYTGSWTKTERSSASLGSYTISNITGDTVELIFYGTGIKWYGITGSNRGIAAVSNDNNEFVVDCYSSKANYRQLLFESNNLALGTHKIVIKVTGTHNPLSTGNYIDLDYFEIIS